MAETQTMQQIERSEAVCVAAGGRYELVEPMLTLHGVLGRVLQRPERAVPVLLQLAQQARKAGRLPHATAALHDLQQALRGCVIPIAYPLQ